MSADYEHAKRSFRLIFDNSPAIMFLIDHRSRRIVAANNAAEDFYGWKRSALESMSINDINSLSTKEIEAEMNNARQSNSNYFRLEHKVAGGEIRDVEVYSGKVEIEGKDYLHHIVHDVTESRQTGKALKENEEKFRALLNQVPEALFLHKLDGTIVDYNHITLEKYGYTAGEILQLKTSDIDPDYKEREDHGLFWKELTQKKQLRFEARHMKKDGAIFPVEISLAPIEMKGEMYYLALAADITERKQAEAALLEHQELLTAIYRNAPLVMMVVDSERRIQQVNGFATQFAGRDAEEMLGLRGGEALRCLHALDDPKGCGFGEYCQQCVIRNTVLDTLNTGETHLQLEAPYHFQKNEKEVREMIFLASTTPIMVKNKRMVLVTLQDITEVKKAQDALQESEEKYRTLVNSTLQGVVIAQSDPVRLAFANPAMEDITGYAPEEFIKMGPEQLGNLIYEEDRQRFFSNFQKRIQGENIAQQNEYRLETKDGAIKWVALYSSRIEYLNEPATLTTFMDVTERKQAEKNLSHLSQMQSIILRMASEYINIPQGLVDESINNSLKELGEFVGADRAYVFDYDWIKNVCNNTYEWCNEGISAEIDNLQNVPNEDIDYWVEAHKHGKEMNIVDVMQLPPDDGVRKILEPQGVKSVLALPMMKSGQCIGFIGFDSVRKIHNYSEKEKTLLKIFSEMLVNIGNRIELEKSLVQAKEKAEESDKLKTAFINNISHEIRTPLNGILGFGEILAESEVPAERRTEMLERVQQSSQRLTNTISDYMDMARIFSGTMLASKKEFALLPLFEEIKEETNHSCARKNLNFKTEIPSGYENLNIHSDPEFVQKILDKLIDNAIKFTQEGSIACGYRIKEENVECFVRDTGCGIKSNKLKLIFDMFSQEDPSTTRNFEGSGLGLTIARGLVHLLGGDIQVVSERGKGSEFTFTIPADDHQQSVFTDTPKTTKKSSHKKPLILIAEDEESNYEYLKTVLRLKGFEYLHAVNGVEAVDYCRQNPEITLVLMDIKMPEMDGLEATRQIREFQPEMPIIATTAYAQTGDENRILAAGCNEYLAKPIKSGDLMALIGKYAE